MDNEGLSTVSGFRGPEYIYLLYLALEDLYIFILYMGAEDLVYLSTVSGFR